MSFKDSLQEKVCCMFVVVKQYNIYLYSNQMLGHNMVLNTK